MREVVQAMQAFLRELQKRSPRIKRAAYLTSVKINLVDSEVHLTGYWTHKEPGSHTVIFKATDVFRYSGTRGVAPISTPCRFADKAIREILESRGI